MATDSPRIERPGGPVSRFLMTLPASFLVACGLSRAPGASTTAVHEAVEHEPVEVLEETGPVDAEADMDELPAAPAVDPAMPLEADEGLDGALVDTAGAED